jgi:hypothetical protein
MIALLAHHGRALRLGAEVGGTRGLLRCSEPRFPEAHSDPLIGPETEGENGPEVVHAGCKTVRQLEVQMRSARDTGGAR